MRNVITFMIACIPSLALAQLPENGQLDLGRLLNDVACTASSTARTFTLSPSIAAPYSVGIFQADYTWSAATEVNMTCQGSRTHGSTWASLVTCGVPASSGRSECKPLVLFESVSASTNIFFRWGITGAADLRCTITCVDGNGSDKFTVYGALTN